MLEAYGWSEALQRQFTQHAKPGLAPGRIVAQHRGRYELAIAEGEVRAEISGRLAAEAAPGGYPAPGDWVAVDAHADGLAIIQQVMDRRTAFTRIPPEGGIQVIAANVDVAFLVASLEAELNARRLERYLVQAWASGATPVILLTKADLCGDLEGAVRLARRSAAGVTVIVLSTVSGQGFDEVVGEIGFGRTAVMVGPSGAGKSTLANRLCGEPRMKTGEVRSDDRRGRHTTSHRQLLVLPSGGLLMDTPGMRELALSDADEGVSTAFDDVEALAELCRFSDCQHQNEPGCAVRAALETGELDIGRWRSFQKLGRELAHQARQEDPLLREQTRKRWIQIHKANRARYKFRERE